MASGSGGLTQPSLSDGILWYVANTTYANLPTNVPTGSQAIASDVGLNGSVMTLTSAGRWVPLNGTCLLASLPMPVYIAPTFTGSTNGAIVLGTALSAASSGLNCWMYFGANLVNASQPAGFYPVVMSSTTAGIVYNNVYVPAAGTYPTWPTSLTAFSGAVPGGAGVTGSDISVFITSLPAGILGSYGRVITRCAIETTNSAGTKTAVIKLGTSTVGTTGLTTSVTASGSHIFGNIGSASSQRGQGTILNTSNASVPRNTTEDTSAAINMSLTSQIATATDVMGWTMADILLEVNR